MNSKQILILLLACLTAQIALVESSLAEKNTAENAAIKKEWESWNAPFQPFRLIANIHYVGASGISCRSRRAVDLDSQSIGTYWSFTFLVF